MLSFAFKLFESISFQRIEVPFIIRGADDLHPLSECFDDCLLAPGAMGRVNFKFFQITICVLNVHSVASIPGFAETSIPN